MTKNRDRMDRLYDLSRKITSVYDDVPDGVDAETDEAAFRAYIQVALHALDRAQKELLKVEV